MEVVDDGAVPLLVGCSLEVDGDDPLDAVAKGGGEEKRSVEVGIGEELLFGIADAVDAAEVVEVEGSEARVGDEAFLVAIGEGAGEGDEGQFLGLEGFLLFGVLDLPEVEGELHELGAVHPLDDEREVGVAMRSLPLRGGDASAEEADLSGGEVNCHGGPPSGTG